MTQQMPNEEIDTAIILEGEIKRRVAQVVEKVVVNMVGKIIHEELNKYKAEMLMEVSINVGKMLRVVENELTVRIDGRYTHDPRNWGYEGPEK